MNFSSILSSLPSRPDKPFIIGLPGIRPRPLYVVPVAVDATEPSSSGGIQKLTLSTNEETVGGTNAAMALE